MTSPVSTSTSDRSPSEPELQRVLGPGLLLLFIVGDILGTGIYALTGTVAGQVGGAVWIPFGCAFLVAVLTACSYLELVTKYPQAAGAALYTQKAFGIHFVTFMVAFTVLSSGITSASTAARAFATNLAKGFGLTFEDGIGLTLAALAFLVVVALVNFRGVGESVRTNVVLTLIELSGLVFILLIGAVALGSGDGDWSAVTRFDVEGDSGAFTAVGSATALAFFALVGFEDSVNMAEETRDPSRIFPRMMFAGLAITGTIYVLVGIIAVALVPLDELSAGSTPLLQVVEVGAGWFPLWIFAFVTMFAVSNTALINMLMASRLVYGLSKEGVVPKALGRVHRGRRTPWVAIIFTTLLGFGLVTFVTGVPSLSGTTSLLLLAVFTVVNVSVLVLRRDPVDHQHFRAPTFVPVLGAIVCLYLVSPLVDRDVAQYRTAGVLLGIGVLLWVVTAVHRRSGDSNRARLDHPEHLA